MLNVSKEIRKCYAHAEGCACKAKEATTEEARATSYNSNGIG